MYILIILGLLVLGALIGAIVTFSMWRHELEDQQKNNSTDTPNPPSSSPVPVTPTPPPQTPQSAPVPETPIAAPVTVVGLNQTFSSRMHVEEIMTTLVRSIMKIFSRLDPF